MADSDSNSDHASNGHPLPTERTQLIHDTPPSSPTSYCSTDRDVRETEEEEEIKEEQRKNFATKTYHIRWFVLLVFCLHLASNNAVWITPSPIADIVACYYGVSLWWINALSWTYMLTYTLLFIPVARFLDVYGLRVTAIVGGCLNAAGCWLRFAGSGTEPKSLHYVVLVSYNIIICSLHAGPYLFWLLLVGQTVASLTNAFEWTTPSLLASVWFPPSERATTSALIGAITPNVKLICNAFGLELHPNMP